MKRFVFGFLTLFLVPVTLAQKWEINTAHKAVSRFWLFLAPVTLTQRWEVTLVSGKTYPYVRLQNIRGDSLSFDTGTYRAFVPLNDVSRVKSSDQFRLLMWGVAGELVGYYAGFRFGKFFAKEIFEMPLESRNDPVVLFTTATGAVLGAVFGIDYARKLGTSSDYDFSSMTREEKRRTVEEILKKRHRSLYLRLLSYLH